MPIRCTFVLNNQSTSAFHCPTVGTLPAFSGRGSGRDNPEATAIEKIGPIPKGIYYIVDRQSGGNLGWLYQAVEKRLVLTAGALFKRVAYAIGR
ncbi:Protein of uncharacterised function (DUF2778) [Burkholderia pseudomallei]|nr:Protein of uncharacterised function (DUF2778) [Burkholderia pseudomallei]